MKGLLRFVKLAIVNKDYARLLCFASIILYVVSLPMHTGIGVETGTEDLPQVRSSSGRLSPMRR